MPRVCTICKHPNVSQIDSSIAKHVAFRTIAKQTDTHYSAVQRHARRCLNFDLGTAMAEERLGRSVDVAVEFLEQLQMAKDLREAARQYLADPSDPLRLMLIPQAHEIEIVYYDHNDMEPVGEVMMPKRKKAMLSAIMQSLAQEGFEPDKYTIKTVDIRKYALEAIAATDVCIDKFARMNGSYKSTPDDKDPMQLAMQMLQFLVDKGWEREKAIAATKKRYPTAPLQLGA